MLVFRMLCRITQSSDAYRTESVSVMDHEQTMGVSEIHSVGPETAKHLFDADTCTPGHTLCIQFSAERAANEVDLERQW